MKELQFFLRLLSCAISRQQVVKSNALASNAFTYVAMKSFYSTNESLAQLAADHATLVFLTPARLTPWFYVLLPCT